MTIRSVLVANRGEIACRVMRSARQMGIATVAVYSDIDAAARHVREADSAVGLGGSKPSESYLVIDKILAAARASGADAIHPGYGFLSENAAFARAVQAAGLVFIGPPASAISAMGSKAAAKALMEAAGVPLVPGYHGEDQSLAALRGAARQIGYPVLLKASAGGGGKGMKVVEHEEDLAASLGAAQREAESAFGDARMLVEKYLVQPRHIEIQVFADRHGHCLYLNERDCSIQRRHQKVVEEAPAPGLAPALRQAMGEAAVKAAMAIGYEGAGTVEFLLDARGGFFFMEMNTRLQVEHPVTEAITGLDLVAWQLRVANGEALPIGQAQVPLHGHAIEVRLYAEDTDQGFLPASGHLSLYQEPPAGDGRRVDSGVAEGDSVSPFYDPMLAKLIAWGEDREQARGRLLAMLQGTAVGGFATNLGFLRRVLAHPAFAEGGADTGFIERYLADLVPSRSPLPDAFWVLAAQAWVVLQRAAAGPAPWGVEVGWRLNARPSIRLHLMASEQRRVVTLSSLEGLHAAPDGLWRSHAGQRQRLAAYLRLGVLYLEWEGRLETVRQWDPLLELAALAHTAGGLSAPMNASVVAVLVQPGQAVEAGTALVLLEAMKMEHAIKAPHRGTVTALFCTEGELVAEGMPLVELAQADAAATAAS
ncbi:biotin carboxylase N-terminal domain-containing protein [Pseudomonas sp. NPDC007930]|uniref:acetyl/propionyl/methylcrotonyl-CoA carboxylase subunit alpha n=1 Tax=Pseudomonas sp. NPDC007930 TaxID=3364417 RepID=UPI0036E23FFB